MGSESTSAVFACRTESRHRGHRVLGVTGVTRVTSRSLACLLQLSWAPMYFFGLCIHFKLGTLQVTYTYGDHIFLRTKLYIWPKKMIFFPVSLAYLKS